MDPILLRQYAAFAVQVGVNIQPGQTLLIEAPVEAAFFAQLCAQIGYEAGAGEVVVHYRDERLSRLRIQFAKESFLSQTMDWQLRKYMDYIEREGTAARLVIVSDDPELYKGLDSSRVETAEVAKRTLLRPLREILMKDELPWSIVAVPGEAWARKVFPGEKTEIAFQKLWEAIFSACRAGNDQMFSRWKEHIHSLQKRTEALNHMQLAKLRMQSANGTDLTIGLATDHLWEGGDKKAATGVVFLPNIPTEEIFTAPHRLHANGTVKSSFPYSFRGELIEDITFVFEGGAVVDYSARTGKDKLRQMMEADEGALHLGEIALVPSSSPIHKSGLLFYNTLFDENAACHIALGAGYPATIQGGENMSREELLEKGLNDSLIHEDIMVGTPDMTITGIANNGNTIPLFENGEWVF